MERFDLTPPIDVRGLLSNYATLEFDHIPHDIDAICIGLKNPGRKPTVIVSSGKPEKRLRFTMAHELGHILIPWHSGMIIDEIHLANFDEDEFYIEAEANRFASELLIPKNYVDGLQILNNPPLAIKTILNEANVSFQAASIKAINDAPAGLVYARLENDAVVSSSKSSGTVASLNWGERLNPKTKFPSAKHFQASVGGDSHHWWVFSVDEPPMAAALAEEWRPLLNQILDDLGLFDEARRQFQMSLNGVISGANSATRVERSPSLVRSNILQRLYSTAMHRALVDRVLNHPLFERFLIARVMAFFQPG